MNETITRLTSVAISVFRSKEASPNQQADVYSFYPSTDPVLNQIRTTSLVRPEDYPELEDLTVELFKDPELALLAPGPEELEPMVLHAGGGMRMSLESMVAGIFSSAFLNIHFFRMPREEGTFVRLVLEGYDELRKAARSEQVRGYVVSGVACISLSTDQRVNTPWGYIHPVIEDPESVGIFFHRGNPPATCVLAEPRLMRVILDKSPKPEFTPDPSEAPQFAVRTLLPLACALASPDPADPIIPILTWSTFLLPFQGSFTFSFPFLPPILKTTRDISDLSSDIEEWARRVDNCHTSAVDIAANRLSMAASHRLDKADSLIDAVMAWENLVGTSTEVTFRVTVALAKLLEGDPDKRRALRKSLSKIYGIRSRVVHGAAIDQSDLSEAANDAIAVAVRALRVSYRRGKEWLNLTSQERADILLLEEP